MGGGPTPPPYTRGPAAGPQGFLLSAGQTVMMGHDLLPIFRQQGSDDGKEVHGAGTNV